MAIGEPVQVLDALARVTGRLNYPVNLRLPNMLVGKIVRSPVPHARILNLDVHAAGQIPGVRAVLTSADITATVGLLVRDQGVLASDRVRFVGEPIVAIAAEDESTAEAAAERVQIDLKELPAVYDTLAAIQSGSPVLHPEFPDNIFGHVPLRHGDIDAGWRAADEIFEDTFTSPVGQQASLEPHVTAAQWQDGRLTVWTAVQAPYGLAALLAGLFQVPVENVRVIVPPMGGAFGGKGYMAIEPIVAALARKAAGRPVKIVLTREEEAVTALKHGAVTRIKTGVRRDGTFAARQVTVYWNGGAYAGVSSFLLVPGMLHSIGPYRIPNVVADSYGVYTNLPPAHAFRGAMTGQTVWAYESQMDMIARRMGWDPLEFRLKNILRERDQFATGETLQDVHFDECLQAVAERLGRRQDNDGPRRRGRGLAVMNKSTLAQSRSVARVRLDADGSLTLFTSTVDMGQGAYTALAQIAADACAIPLSSVRVVGADTAFTPFDSATSNSRSTSAMGSAIAEAGKRLKGKLLELAAPILENPTTDLKIDQGQIVSSPSSESCSFAEVLKRHNLEFLEATGEYTTKLGIDPKTGQGIATPHWHQGAGAAEVEVDAQTGKVTVLRYYASAWAGRVVNPRLAQLQNDGNVIFGIGPTLMEETVLENGRVANPNIDCYQIPSLPDIPGELVSISLEGEEGEIHGLGEMTLPPVAPAIANAIDDAIGVRIRDLPLTPEKVLRAIKEKRHDDTI